MVRPESSNFEETPRDFLERAERLMIIQDVLRDRIKADPNIAELDLHSAAGAVLAKFSATKVERAICHDVIKRYVLQHQRVKELIAYDAKDPKMFVEHVFGFIPKGEVVVTPRTVSVHFTFRHPDDFKEFLRKQGFEEGEAREVGALALPGRLTNAPSGRILPRGIVTVSGWGGERAEKVNQMHEEEHQIQNMMRGVILERLHQRVVRKVRSLEKQLTIESADSAKDRIWEQIFETLELWNLGMYVSDELLAKLTASHGSIRGEVYANPHYYRNWREHLEGEIRETVALVKSSEYPSVVQIDVETIIQKALHRFDAQIENALIAIDTLLSLRVIPRQQAVSLLSFVPLPKWRPTVERVLARNSGEQKSISRTRSPASRG